MSVDAGFLIDGLQYSNWSEGIFRQLRAGRVDAVHVTLTYHETFRETVANIYALREPISFKFTTTLKF